MDVRRTTRALPVWAIVLVAVVVVVLGAGVVLGVTTLRSASAERAVRAACGEAVGSQLGTGVSDVDTTTYPALVRKVDGPGPGRAYRADGEVDFTRGGKADRGYYTCEARRSGGTTTVTGVTGL